MLEFINRFQFDIPRTAAIHTGCEARRFRGILEQAPTMFIGYRQIAPVAGQLEGMMKSASEERAIVEAVLQGDVEDFRILVERYRRPVYNLMLRITRATMTAEDLTQDVFERAYAKLHTFKTGKRFFPWLYAIAVNAGKDHLRRQGVRQDVFQRGPDSIEPADPDTHSCAKRIDCVMDASRLSDAVDRLPLKYGEPLLLYYREGFSVKEIATALGISESSVKVRIHRGRHLIKAAIGVTNEST